MNYQDLTHTLIESFNALADEVQNLIDRKTILEHKLRYAHEQYQYLADKYAPAVPEVSETLAKLQLPPDVHHPALINSIIVPLPKPGTRSDNAQIALFIREGRKVARELSGLTSTTAPTSKASISSSKAGDPGAGERGGEASTAMTTLSTTALEQDFTVEGRKGPLGCPFAAKKPPGHDHKQGKGDAPSADERDAQMQDPTPHHSADPICAAMFEESTSQPAPPSAGGGANKCPIRFLDQHSAEEIAHYVETHKHELPRSHEVCIERYQRNEDQIRKLDAKYGSLVSMIQDLSQLHRPMMPAPGHSDRDGEAGEDIDSTQRVKDWAHDVSAVNAAEPEESPLIPAVDESLGSLRGPVHEDAVADVDLAREGHFDRPLKEVRVGESPSRPWGISVPVYADEDDFDPSSSLRGNKERRPVSPPPAPVQMGKADPVAPLKPVAAGNGASKCPFSHLAQLDGAGRRVPPHPLGQAEHGDAGERRGSSMRNESLTGGGDGQGFGDEHDHNHHDDDHGYHGKHHSSTVADHATPHLPSPKAKQTPAPPLFPYLNPQSAFVNPPVAAHRGHERPDTASAGVAASPPAPLAPQMLFTGPVFIGYPIEQAIQFMQHFQAPQ